MNILIITASYPPAFAYGGPPVAAHATARELQHLGQRVQVLTCNLDQGKPMEVSLGMGTEWEGVPVRYCQSWPVWNFISPELARELRRHLPSSDICLTRGNWGFVNFITNRLCRRNRISYVLYPEGSFDPWAIRHKAWKKLPWWWLGERRIYHQAAAVIALTQAEADQMRHLGITTRVEIIPNGVFLEEFHQGLSRTELEKAIPGLGAGPFLLFLGRLHPKKGLHLLLPALARLPERFREVRLVVAGPDEGGYRSRMITLAEELGLSSRVLFLGPVHGALKVGLLREASLFVLNSLSEGLPLAVLEAMAAGTPVLLSPACNLPEVAAAGAGLIVPLEFQDIARALESLLSDAAALQEMGANGRRLVEAKFTWKHVGRLTEALCAELINTA